MEGDFSIKNSCKNYLNVIFIVVMSGDGPLLCRQKSLHNHTLSCLSSCTITLDHDLAEKGCDKASTKPKSHRKNREVAT